VRAAPCPRAAAPWPGAAPRCRVRAQASAGASGGLARISRALPGASRAFPRVNRPLARASSPLGRVNRPLGLCQLGLGCVRDDPWSVSVGPWNVSGETCSQGFTPKPARHPSPTLFPLIQHRQRRHSPDSASHTLGATHSWKPGSHIHHQTAGLVAEAAHAGACETDNAQHWAKPDRAAAASETTRGLSEPRLIWEKTPWKVLSKDLVLVYLKPAWSVFSSSSRPPSSEFGRACP
jgi:hypothetical protein